MYGLHNARTGKQLQLYKPDFDESLACLTADSR
jgi:hypothetical protein